MKNKTTRPNMAQWKEFRYNLVKEDIEIDTDNEAEIPEPCVPKDVDCKNKKTSKYFDVSKWRETQKNIVKENIIKEEGDPYEVTIFLQDAGDNFYLSIEDNQGNEDAENFTSLKDVYDYILNYINKWDLS